MENRSRSRRKNKKYNFKKFLRTYIVLLFILMIIFLIYVINSLKTYERLQIDNYLDSTVKKIQKGIKRRVDVKKAGWGQGYGA